MNKLPYINFVSDEFQDFAIFSLSAKIYVDYCKSIAVPFVTPLLGWNTPFVGGSQGAITYV